MRTSQRHENGSFLQQKTGFFPWFGNTEDSQIGLLARGRIRHPFDHPRLGVHDTGLAGGSDADVEMRGPTLFIQARSSLFLEIDLMAPFAFRPPEVVFAGIVEIA